jgi:hypothetical protein
VVNKRGLTIQASHYEPVAAERPRKQLPCVIYLHGNCGCRLDAIECLPILLPYNITLVALDFSGSGASEGTRSTAHRTPPHIEQYVLRDTYG